MKLPTIIERKRFRSPTVTPQALAWDGKQLWMSSRDLGFFYKLNADGSKIVDEVDPPGVVWAAVQTNGAMHLNDDRYIYRDRKSTRLNSSHSQISYAVFCLKKKTWHLPQVR